MIHRPQKVVGHPGQPDEAADCLQLGGCRTYREEGCTRGRDRSQPRRFAVESEVVADYDREFGEPVPSGEQPHPGAEQDGRECRRPTDAVHPEPDEQSARGDQHGRHPYRLRRPVHTAPVAAVI